jgi:hypothetical protein
MKIRTMFIVTVFALAGSVLAIDAKSVEETIATTPLFIPASDLKWSDLDPAGAAGVKVVDLWVTIKQVRSAHCSNFLRDLRFRYIHILTQ